MSLSQDLLSLIRHHVKFRPAALAVQDDSFTLTYSELERWSNNLAQEIRSRNTTGSCTVAVCVPRSTIFVVAVLAIVKAGFSYLPLDPDAPPARLDDQIMQADARLLLTVSWLQLPSLEQAIPFDIVPFIDRTCVLSYAELPSSGLITRNDTLVIFFTSGSTGRPKGVVVQHNGMLNMINSHFMEIQAGDRVSMVNNPAFDASSIDIWNTLCHGGTLLVLTAHLADTEAVISFFREREVTKAFLPTAVFHHIVSNVSNVTSMSTTLRMVAVGGEKLATTSVQNFFRRAPTTRLLNAYGPSEASVFTTTFEIPSLNFSTEYDDATSRPIPIGRCIPNSAVYLLDDNLSPVDVGLPGEICICGAGLAAGYLGQADLTANKFVTVNDLEGRGSSTRIYRTGDIGRFVPSADGPVLEFVGRSDTQTKIRGQRIELGEIEAVLCAGSDEIDQAAVVFSDEQDLIAYVVPTDNHIFEGQHDHGEQSDDSSKLRDAVYAQGFENIDPAVAGIDFTGWVSMYDGMPIPIPEMQDWLSDTLQSIPVKQSDSVLEIGCGTGMILFALEPRCQEYSAVDMLGSVLAFIQARLTERGLQDKVALYKGMAHELDQMLPSEKRFDLIVLNSVVQHFSSSEYLENLIRLCIDRLQDGGRIFLGDIRNHGVDKHHDLARVLHCDPSPDLSTLEIQERLERWQHRQMELKLDPSFFFSLQQKLGNRVSHIEVVPKMMSARNELSQFRYQVILSIGKSAPALIKPGQWIDYTTASDLEKLLSYSKDITAVRGIPNSLVAIEQGMLHMMSSSQPPASASELVAAASTLGWCTRALSPADVVALCARQGYQVDLSLKSLGVDQTMAAIFLPGSSMFKGDFSSIPTAVQLANTPLHFSTASDLITKLQARCLQNLPSYMVPHRVIITQCLPLTGNGKVDRKMLAQSSAWAERSRVPSQSNRPKNKIQALIQECISGVLNKEPLNIPLETDFIALGLHSFRAPVLLNALRAQFSIPDLPFRIIFQYPSVKALSEYLTDKISSNGSGVTIPLEKAARREVSYDHDALRQVLELRGLTMEDVEDVYETTFTQKFCLMGPSPRSYMIHQLVTVRTDIDLLISALETVISRHTALRSTVFANLQHQVVFHYHQKLRDDMIHVYPAEDARSVENIVKDDSRYALTIPGNLIKFDVFRTEPPTLLILAQHAVMDAWSRECLFQDLDRIISGKQLSEPVPFRRYVDYMIAEENSPARIAWHADRLRTAEIIAFPECDQSTFNSSSYFGPHFLRVEEFPGVGKFVQKYSIKLSTLFKVAFAIVKRNESKYDTVIILQTEACRSLPIEGITQICGPTVNVAADRIDFLRTDTVLKLLHRAQQNQDMITDLSVVNYIAVLADVGIDMALLATSGYTFSQNGTPTYDVLQPGPTGAENNIGVEWTTLVDGEQVKVRVDHDPIFSDRIPGYVDQFLAAARWLIANIEAESLDGLQL